MIIIERIFLEKFYFAIKIKKNKIYYFRLIYAAFVIKCKQVLNIVQINLCNNR